tara:strand:+ start:149 stop:499 length:351 start_codon:yes stop_codon:yes gene_type:complete
MKDVFFKDYVKITMPSPITEDFELLIGALNEPLQKNFGICICYDQDENGFSGFALTNQFHSETIYPEVKTSMNKEELFISIWEIIKKTEIEFEEHLVGDEEENEIYFKFKNVKEED